MSAVAAVVVSAESPGCAHATSVATSISIAKTIANVLFMVNPFFIIDLVNYTTYTIIGQWSAVQLA